MTKTTVNQQAKPGIRTFTTIWFGQVVSLVGSGLTDFALGVWVYQHTGSATQFALISLFTTLPIIVIAPLAGSLVDRWNRRWTMVLGNTGAALSLAIIVLLLLTNRLEIWHIYLAVAANSIFSALQWLAYSSTIALLIPKDSLGRASGMFQFGESLRLIVSPALAGILLVALGLEGVILADLLTFLFAVMTLLVVEVPQPLKPQIETQPEAHKDSLLQDIAYGWTYIRARPGLMGMLLFFAVTNFFVGIVTVLGTPFVLSFASPDTMGIVLSIAGSGMLIGGLLMSAWGGPKQRIYGVLGFEVLGGLSILIAGLWPSVPLFAVMGAVFFFRLPIVNGSREAIWQSKVRPEVQGRVFAMQRVISWSARPLAFLIAGPLADNVFEPAMAAHGLLAGTIGQIVGVGQGRGIGLIFVLVGILTTLASLVAYLSPRVRLVESELPDIMIAGNAPAISE